ncbi:LysR family transcriptional regulator [Pelagibacterium lentulum]|uniref:LysR family transcriptional regulator n=1 Tax=Pelagibacterium lentulum TaxID=2029865 RepID=A0A916R9Z6_9HYPH|nr:LysR family transcriptional regulator [Pelagibacterium lentulum]GGA40535.1 LysR family transcriptional regulator [Pelagibacterium lentulum]
MKNENWEDIRLFLIVARRGGLTGAAQETGMSPPTIGRRMLALERSMGRSLLVRGPTGYSLAVDGQILYERAKSMEAAAHSIIEWQQDILKLPIVSIGADTWTLRLIMENLSTIWTPSDSFRICLKVFDAGIDFTYRDAHIGIVADRPVKGNAATRPAGRRSYAPYRSLLAAPETEGNWVSLGTDTAPASWMRWTFSQAHLPIIAWTNSQTGLLDLIRAGAGTGVLPCMVGDKDPLMTRAGPVIKELEHASWLVMHDDDRHRQEVRLTIDRLGAFLTG